MRPRISSLTFGVSTLAKGSTGSPAQPPQLATEYDLEITQESYREIGRLALWAKAKGPQFFLIGGWAAWRYHRGYGSRDIDVIFPNQVILDAFLTEYYRSNGYELTGGLLAPSYRKPVETPKGIRYIEIDAAHLDGGFPFHEDTKLDLPYRLLERYHQVWRVEGQEVLLPTPELLLLQKVKAYRDRSWDLAHRDIDVGHATFLRSKIAKDAYDIRGLAPHVAEWPTVTSIATRSACRHLVADTLAALGIRDGL